MRGRTRGIPALLFALTLTALGCQAKPPAEPVSASEGASPHEDAVVTLTPESQRAAEIVVEEVAFRPLQRKLQAPGSIQVNQNRLAHVGPRIPGRIVEIKAGLGERVKAGATLAVIDSPELGQAQSDYLTARAKLVVAEKAFERAKTLLEGKVIGTGEYQRREGEYLAAKAEAQAAEDRLTLLGMTDDAIAALGGERAIRSQVAITAPFGGTVIDRRVTLGEVVEPGKALFTIADLSVLWGIAEIPEQDLARVKKGLPAEVSVSAYPGEKFQGRTTYLSETIDPSSRTVNVRVDVDNGRGKLKPEMFATFTIVTDEADRVLSLPDTAIQREGGKAIVFVAKGEGRFEKRPVELGPESQGWQVVRSGLQPGEQVVTKGAFVLKSETLKGQMEE